MLPVAADVGFVAVEALIVFARVTRVGIGRASGAGRLGGGTFAAGFHQRRIHQRDAFDDVTTRFQLAVEQTEQFFVQAAGDEPLPKPADGGFIRHGLVRGELHKLLEAQPILELLFGLRIAQAVEMLQDHDAQQHADAAGAASAFAVSGGDAFLGGSEIHFAGDGFQNSVGAAPLLHGQIEESGLVFAFGLHGLLMRLRQRLFNYFCRDFLKGRRDYQ